MGPCAEGDQANDIPGMALLGPECGDAGQCVGLTGIQASSGSCLNEVCGEELQKRIVVSAIQGDKA